MSTSTWNEYNHLEAHGLDEKTCQGLFSDQCSWSLSRKPTVGFYLELMTYKRNHFPTLTNREMEYLNNRKRKIDHTEMVSYGAAKRPKETFSPQQVPESPSTSTALLDPESAPVILAPEEKVSIYHLWYMYVHGVDIYTFSYFRSAQRLQKLKNGTKGKLPTLTRTPIP